MRRPRIGFTALLLFLVATLIPVLLHQTASFSTPSVEHLLTNARKAEADPWMHKAIQPFHQQQFEAAIPSNQQAQTIYQDRGDRLSWGQSLNQRGLRLYEEGQLQEAEKILRDGIQVWESLPAELDRDDADSVSLWDSQVHTYQLLQKVLIAQNKILAALEIAERSRARAFVELMIARAASDPTVTSNLTPPTLEQIQQIAKEQNSTLVEYSLIDNSFNQLNQPQTQISEELFIWVIQPTGEVTFRQSDLQPLWQEEQTTLADFVGNIRQSLGALSWGLGRSRPMVRPFQQLYQVLIAPIADKLPTDPNAHIIFIPQQSLLMIPFSPLQDDSGTYLLEKHTILTAPAIMVLDLTHQARQRIPESATEWLVVGNPEPMPDNFAPLPAAAQEAEAIASLVKTTAITGNVATKAEILQRIPSSRVIHLATHGILNESQAWESAIAFAPTPTDNGWLTAQEILDLKLSAELIVLSACNTGRGRITGDSIIGLSGSLISSGASSAIVSLWSIPDSPTAFLMEEFYHHLQENSDKAQGLRQAMLTTMARHPALRDWAAFTLIGES